MDIAGVACGERCRVKSLRRPRMELMSAKVVE